ncbi:MAG TPA: maleylpyruvate isomerase N-terminal domain-containing protein [Nakamurella sp.]|nr:maleylpyruvate isomerase N-terminal domain-containing protein [Nakamurella sp.]
MDSPSADAFDSAARWFLQVSAAAAGHHDEPGLGEWSVRDLVGHTSRSLLTVEAYLDVDGTDAGPVDLVDAVAYYLAIANALTDTTAVVQRGRDAGAALGDEPMVALRALVARVPELVRAAPATAIVRTPFGSMTLQGYLPTRTLELTVHTCDLAAALGVPAAVPPDAAAETFALIGGLAAAQGTASSALLALTGRRPLPTGYSVL